MVWMGKEADQVCRCLYRKTSGFLNSIFGSSKDSGFIESRSSGKRRDSSAVQDLDFDLHHDNRDHHVASSSSRFSLSRSSSQASVCSCMACSHSGEWKRRPSRLLEGYDVEDFYRFDAVLGKVFYSGLDTMTENHQKCIICQFSSSKNRAKSCQNYNFPYRKKVMKKVVKLCLHASYTNSFQFDEIFIKNETFLEPFQVLESEMLS